MATDVHDRWSSQLVDGASENEMNINLPHPSTATTLHRKSMLRDLALAQVDNEIITRVTYRDKLGTSSRDVPPPLRPHTDRLSPPRSRSISLVLVECVIISPPSPVTNGPGWPLWLDREPDNGESVSSGRVA